MLASSANCQESQSKANQCCIIMLPGVWAIWMLFGKMLGCLCLCRMFCSETFRRQVRTKSASEVGEVWRRDEPSAAVKEVEVSKQAYKVCIRRQKLVEMQFTVVCLRHFCRISPSHDSSFHFSDWFRAVKDSQRKSLLRFMMKVRLQPQAWWLFMG